MTYSYDAGSSTPGYAGLIEVGGIRLNSATVSGSAPSGGTFKLESGPFNQTPPTRVQAMPLGSDSGGIPSPTYTDSWQFTITGWLWVPSGPDDVPAAEDQLRGVFAAQNGLLTLVGNFRNWTYQRQLYAQTVGSIVFTPRHGPMKVATRNFTIPMLASDPLAYNTASTTVNVPMTGAATGITNHGTAWAPFTARFNGPFTTSATLTRASDGATLALGSSSNAFSLAAGEWVDVQTNPAGNAVVSAKKNDGSNVFNYVTAFSALRLPPVSTGNWSSTATSGTTGASGVAITYRDAWA